MITITTRPIMIGRGDLFGEFGLALDFFGNLIGLTIDYLEIVIAAREYFTLRLLRKDVKYPEIAFGVEGK